MDWYRSELKRRANDSLKRNYWRCILVALIVFLITPSTGNASISVQSSTFYEASGTNPQIAAPFTESYGMEYLNALPQNVKSTLGAVILLIWLSFLFIIPVLQVGGCSFFLENAWISNAGIRQLFHAFKHNYLTTVLTMFLRNLFLFLWACVSLVPFLFCVFTQNILAFPCVLLFVLPVMKAYEYRMIPYLLADRPELSCREILRQNKRLMKKQKWNVFVLDLSFWGWSILSAFTFNILGILYVNPYRYATNAELYLALKRAEEARLSY